eukprot:1503758-Amphidinium_carterae.1
MHLGTPSPPGCIGNPQSDPLENGHLIASSTSNHLVVCSCGRSTPNGIGTWGNHYRCSTFLWGEPTQRGCEGKHRIRTGSGNSELRVRSHLYNYIFWDMCTIALRWEACFR